jgi:hypothetical protein
MKRRGKIAHLSWALQNQLNIYLEQGEPGKAVLPWLNSLPEMQSIVRDFFAGKPVSKQNLSEWTHGGFQEWRVRMGKVEGALNLARDAADLETCTDGRLADRLATFLSGRYANLLQSWDGEVTEEFSKKLKALRSMVLDSAQLRRWDHDSVRVRLTESAHAANQEQTNEALFAEFEKWAKKPKIREYLLMEDQTHQERQKRDRERWELLKTPVKRPPEEPPSAAPASPSTAVQSSPVQSRSVQPSPT